MKEETPVSRAKVPTEREQGSPPGEKRTRLFFPTWLAVLALSCSSASPRDRPAGAEVEAGAAGEAGAEPEAGAAGEAGAEPEAGAGGAAGAEAGALSEPPWCTVQAILARKCQRCHDTLPAHGAPFALITYDDTQSKDNKGKARFERIAHALDKQLMPPQSVKLDPPVEPLTDAERATILNWCAQSAPLTGGAACADTP